MRVRKLRQRELFDDEPPAPPALPREAREEALQLLTQWLRTLSQTMAQGGGDEQDRR
jgi:hypothetical protein